MIELRIYHLQTDKHHGLRTHLNAKHICLLVRFLSCESVVFFLGFPIGWRKGDHDSYSSISTTHAIDSWADRITTCALLKRVRLDSLFRRVSLRATVHPLVWSRCVLNVLSCADHCVFRAYPVHVYGSTRTTLEISVSRTLHATGVRQEISTHSTACWFGELCVGQSVLRTSFHALHTQRQTHGNCIVTHLASDRCLTGISTHAHVTYALSTTRSEHILWRRKYRSWESPTLPQVDFLIMGRQKYWSRSLHATGVWHGFPDIFYLSMFLCLSHLQTCHLV